MKTISPAFRDGQAIPIQYTGSGQNINPPLTIFDVPKAAQSLTLIMHDTDAPGGDYLHWLVWDIPPKTESISVNSVPIGAVAGTNDSGGTGYTGPAPPDGTGAHKYIFDFYALDTTLDLPAGAKMADVIVAQKGHVLDHSSLSGTFEAPAQTAE